MKTAFLLCVAFLLFAGFLESADVGNYAIPLEVMVNGKTIPAATYTIRVESNSIQLVKENEILATEPAIVLPAAGSDETTISVVKTKKQDYVRIRTRFDRTWYIVYLPATQHATVSTQHS